MDQETLMELVDVNILIQTKQRFLPGEQSRIYNLFNKITGENRKPNGCGACLSSVTSRLKKEARLHGI